MADAIRGRGRDPADRDRRGRGRPATDRVGEAVGGRRARCQRAERAIRIIGEGAARQQRDECTRREAHGLTDPGSAAVQRNDAERCITTGVVGEHSAAINRDRGDREPVGDRDGRAGTAPHDPDQRQRLVVIGRRQPVIIARIIVDDVEARSGIQSGRDDDVVERLVIAVEIIGVPLFDRQFVDQVRQRAGVARGCQRLQRGFVVEAVEVAIDDELVRRIAREDRIDIGLGRGRLRGAGGVTGIVGRLVRAVQRVRSAARGGVHVDRGKHLTVEHEIGDGGLARAVISVGLDRGRRSLDIAHPLGVEEEAVADVAVGCAPADVGRGRRDLDIAIGRAARCCDRVDQLLRGRGARQVGAGILAIGILDFLHADDVGIVQRVDDLVGVDREARIDGRLLDRIGGVGIAGRPRGHGRQVLQVEARIAQPRCRSDQIGRLAGQGGRDGRDADRADRVDLVLTSEVIHDTGDVVQRVALVISARGRCALIDLDRLGVHVACRDRHAAPAVQTRSANAQRRDDIGLAIGIGIGDDPRRADGDPHPLERFIEIGAIGGRIVAGETIVIDHLGGRGAAGAVGRNQHRGRQRDRWVGDGDRGRAAQLRDRQVGRSGREFGDRTRQRDRIADRDCRRGRTGRDEDRIRRGVIAVAVRVLDVEAVAAHRGDDAAGGDDLAGEQRAMTQTLDVVDRNRAGIVVENRRGRAGGGNDEADRVGQVDDEGLVRFVDPVAVDEDRDRLARLAGSKIDRAGLRDIVAACLRGAVRRGVADARGTDAAGTRDREDRGSGTAITLEKADIADRGGGIGA